MQTKTNSPEIETLIANAANITVINDGQVKYPVETEDMQDWEKENGEITTKNYQEFCDSVDIAGNSVCGMVGTQGMIDLCDALVESGASSRSL